MVLSFSSALNANGANIGQAFRLRQLRAPADSQPPIQRLPADVSNAGEKTNAAFMILT
jgi:hypothetical protein